MKLTVNNFQIHKSKTVDIPEGETTYLEGDSDIGKSALLRAMRWIGENKPDGGSFVTFKTPRGTTSLVKLEDAGHVVERERGKSKNAYRLDGETFEAFGRTVPEPVAKFLNLSPYAFQLQGEVPFLIGASPTDAAKILSDACGLGVIDTAAAFVRGKKTAAEAEIRKSEILLESAQGRLTQATEQLPLADALEKAARTGEEVLSLTDRYGWIAHVLDDEPLGEVRDVEGVRLSAAAAHAVQCEVQSKLLQIDALARAIRAEPTGALLDVEAVRPVVARLNLLAAALLEGSTFANWIQSELDAEPVGTAYDLEAVKMIAGEARVIGGWLKSVTASRDRMRLVLASEPVGDIINTAGIAEAIAKARATQEERAMLGKMCQAMFASINAEPQGNLIDTTELQQQRARIKVCPQCGRQL
jgi:energy-coupling factor transporter ATP-binding protein EcfA2